MIVGWLNIEKSGYSDIQFADKLLNINGLGLATGTAFGSNMNIYVRMTFAASENTINLGLEKLLAFSKSH